VLSPEEESVSEGSLAGAGDVDVAGQGPLVTRLFELVAGSVCLTLLAPVFLLASIAIKFESRGPIFIRESRFGYKNQVIRVRKFRATTVYSKGEQRAPRLTAIGRLLRQTGIEELPMFINVLAGEMSIIGPPPSAYPVALLNRRKPGVTRWAEMLRSQNHAPD
jgi:lipopolysaccharide/colanic/teichoic acid biosynthesis glycosyltransferase